jgi:adenine-specific DNA methylase
VHDTAYKNSLVTLTIHDYFLAKFLDKLRTGGVMALITSRYTMDKQDSTIRRYLSDRADLVGAIRMPNTAFKANAGTEVTTDILFLQRRAPGRRR